MSSACFESGCIEIGYGEGISQEDVDFFSGFGEG